MENNNFIDGLFAKPPHENAPDFVKARLSMKREELLNWLSQKSDEWINIDMKVSKTGKWYCQVNDYKPEKTEDPLAQAREAFGNDEKLAQDNSIELSDIPF
jgi:hypothetical protein